MIVSPAPAPALRELEVKADVHTIARFTQPPGGRGTNGGRRARSPLEFQALAGLAGLCDPHRPQVVPAASLKTVVVEAFGEYWLGRFDALAAWLCSDYQGDEANCVHWLGPVSGDRHWRHVP